MRLSKVLLIAPASDDLRVPPGERPRRVTRVFRHSQQLGLLYVAAALPPGVEVKIIDEAVEAIDFNAPADLVGITCMTPHAPRAYAIADRFRAQGRAVILGGYHASFLPHEALLHADAVCVGEAENNVPRMVEDFNKGNLNGAYANGPVDLRLLAVPNRQLIRRRDYLIDAIQGSRGCPNACHYCSDTRFFHHTFRTRPARAVAEELEQLGRRVIFLDSNIIGDPDHAKRLFQEIRPLRKRWISQCSTRIADDRELLQLAAESGCAGLFIGLETANQASLQGVNKGFNLVDRYEDQIKKIHDRGISILAGLMFGMDEDRPDVFGLTLDLVLRAQVDAINPFILTPFPGTPLHASMERQGRIISRNWTEYDFTHVVFKPKHMTPDELRDGRERVLREFYSVRRAFGRIVHSLVNFGPEAALWFALPFNAAYWHVARQYARHGRPTGRIASSGSILSGFERPAPSPVSAHKSDVALDRRPADLATKWRLE